MLLQRLLSVTKQNGNWNGNVAEKNHPRNDLRPSVQARPINFVLQTERLKHAAHAVTQVQAQQPNADNVKCRNPDISEADHHHFENVVPLLRVLKGNKTLAGEIDVLHLHRVMEQVINDENENNNSAHQHRSRCVRGSRGIPIRVGDGTRRLVFDRKINGRPDVETDHQQQEYPRRPDEFDIGLQEMSVAIDGIRAEKKLQIPHQMPHHKQKKYKARYRHDV